MIVLRHIRENNYVFVFPSRLKSSTLFPQVKIFSVLFSQVNIFLAFISASNNIVTCGNKLKIILFPCGNKSLKYYYFRKQRETFYFT